jgi:O-antigen ligase
MADGFARAAFFALLPVVGVGGALGVPVLLCLAGAASLRPSLLRQAVENPSLSVGLLLLLTAWVCASAAWSPHASGIQALQIATMVPLGLLFVAAAVEARGRRLTRAAGAAAFFILAALLTVEALGDLFINRAAQPDELADELLRNAARGATLLLALTWTTVAALLAYRKPAWTGLAVAATAAGGFIALQFGQSANTLAFAVGLAAFAAAYLAPRLAVAAASLGLAAWMLAAPFLTPLLSANLDTEAMPRSWTERIRIWTYVSERIAEQPWVGHGLDAARAPQHADVPLHPHSASLHLWFDTGAVGAVLAAALLAVGGWALAQRFADNRPAAAATAATLASLGVVANVSNGLWAEWWICTMFVAAALVGALAAGRGASD